MNRETGLAASAFQDVVESHGFRSCFQLAVILQCKKWSGWDGVGTAAVTLVGPIAYFTRVSWKVLHFGKLLLQITLSIASAMRK